MSHFTVMVFGDNWEEQLAPFQENNMGDCPEEFMEFNDTEDEEHEKWLTGTTEVVVLPDGRLVSKWDDMFRTKPWTSSDSHVVPEELEKRTVPFTELYPTFEQFMADYVGYSERDPKTGRYGYWHNPNSKWDWYQVGGRWTGYFKVKEGAEATVGEPGVFGNRAREGYADQLRKGDIDFEGMYADAMEEAAERYDKFEEVTAGLEVPPTWAEVRGMYPDIEEARKVYRAYPWVDALQKADLMPFFGDAHEVWRVRAGGRSAYIENAKCKALLPFAVIVDGKWYEKGEMGWWGLVIDEKLEYDWSAKFMELFESLPDDTLITICDCHI
ncbi:MAG: hypothetical protein WC279_14770 [Sulfurimonas sp.]|jgi:hypothetical protein|uniref:hypothetical protein n=1 Tax=Sulfurimonas sp. TaxID=2022749 RepID=UPI00356AAFCC|nr:hypothetical protein [Dehalococcoidia bacterium]